MCTGSLRMRLPVAWKSAFTVTTTDHMVEALSHARSTARAHRAKCQRYQIPGIHL
jgi:hypothetical protein